MAVLDEDFGTDLTLVEGSGGVRLCSVSVPERAPRDWRSQCERERARADAAEAHAEELRWAEVASRSDAGSWKSRFTACRRRLSAAVEETKEARRAARGVPSLQAEVARLETLLSEAGIGSNESSTTEALRKENARLRKALVAPEAREGAIGPRPAETRRRLTALERSPDQKDTIRTLRKEITRLNNEVVRRDKQILQLNKRLDLEKESTESIREAARKLSSESLRLHREVRILGDSEARARSLSDEVFWLRHALEVFKAGQEKLKARLVKLRAAGATLSKLPSDEAAQLRAALRRSRRQETTIEALRKDNARLRRTMRKLETRKAALEVQPAKLRAIRKALESELAGLRAVRKTLSKSLSVADADLRRDLRRSRRQKATIKSLSRENARLRKGAKTSRNRIETLEVQLERLRATGAVLSRALYGRKSEQQDKPGSERKRGQQRGAPGHGRTQRPGLKERTEEHNPPPDACVCGRCGQPYAPNGAEESTLVEIEVKAHKRVIRRPRWRRTCECASSPMEVSSPPVPRLFPRTLYGTSFWARFLFEHCACLRPLHRVAAWFSSQGLGVSPGTLADSLKRFVPLFEPVAKAILAHQNKAALRHADETGWRVQELRGEDRSSRAWLWTSVSNDAVSFHIDPSRSAEAALELFAEGLLDTVIVCDRYSAYKRLARLREGKVTLAFCWSHMRRDFIERLQATRSPSRGQGDPCILLVPYAPRFYRVRGRPGETDGLVPGMDRADRGDLPAERGAAGALRPRSRTPDTGVRRAAGRVGSGGRPPVRGRRSGVGRPVGEGAQGQAAALASQPPRGVVRLRRQATGSDGQQQGRARAPGASHRTTIKLRFEQRGRRQVHGDHVLGGGHALDERHRRPALAGSVARSLREERPQTAG